MKTTTIKTFALLAVTIGLSSIVHAQTENTSERLITQLKNGTAPGLLFSNERTTPAPVLNKKLNEKEGLITQIRKGTAAGMQFKSGGGGSAPVAARIATAVPTQPLASEQKPVAEKATAAPAVLPKQE
jgi:hypothetical protein